MFIERIYAGPSPDDTASKVVVALPVERLGDGADGLGVHTPVDDTGPTELPVERLDKGVCAVCRRQLLGHRIHPWPPGLTGKLDAEFRGMAKAVICPSCDAVFCHRDSYHRAELRHRDSLQTALCSNCGTSLAAAPVLIFTQSEKYARDNLAYKPGTESLIWVRHDGNEQVRFPERCVTCGSESALEFVDIEVEHSSVIKRKWVEQKNWQGTTMVPVPFQRSNTAVFAAPFCFRHRPTTSNRLKAALHQSFGGGAKSEMRLDGWTLAFVDVWEPWWRPRLLTDGAHGLLVWEHLQNKDGEASAGRVNDFLAALRPGSIVSQPDDPKRGLNHPVWFFSFEFDDEDYHRDFVAANTESISYRNEVIWEAFAAELGFDDTSPALSAIARRWAARQHGRVGLHARVETMEGRNDETTITLYLDHPAAKKSTVKLATITDGRLVVKSKHLRKKCGLTDADLIDFDEVCERNLGVRTGGLDSGLSITDLDVERLVATVAWIDERLDRRLVPT